MWQDLVITAGTGLLAVMLIPTLVNKDAAVPLTTSVPTALVLGIFSYTMLTLGLDGAAIINALSSVLWTLVARFRQA